MSAFFIMLVSQSPSKQPRLKEIQLEETEQADHVQGGEKPHEGMVVAPESVILGTEGQEECAVSPKS